MKSFRTRGFLIYQVERCWTSWSVELARCGEYGLTMIDLPLLPRGSDENEYKDLFRCAKRTNSWTWSVSFLMFFSVQSWQDMLMRADLTLGELHQKHSLNSVTQRLQLYAKHLSMVAVSTPRSTPIKEPWSSSSNILSWCVNLMEHTHVNKTKTNISQANHAKTPKFARRQTKWLPVMILVARKTHNQSKHRKSTPATVLRSHDHNFSDPTIIHPRGIENVLARTIAPAK